jgi:hypothetical protein
MRVSLRDLFRRRKSVTRRASRYRPRLQPLEDRSLLAVTVYVNDDWSTLSNGDDITDADPVTPGDQAAEFGTDAFATIQAGIDNVDAGGTVNVLAGTYNESPAIGQSLSLLGIEGRDVTTINLQSGPTYLGGIDINGTDVTLSGFTIVGFDGTATTLASSNILVHDGLGQVTISNNRILVGAINTTSSNGDDGFGILTYYNETNIATDLTVEGNLFEPVGSEGGRAFYINPGVDDFVFRDNEITGRFTRTAITQADDSLIEDNVVTGDGTSAGLGVWGYPDPDEFGQATFRNNTIQDTANAITVFEANNVTIVNNQLLDNGTAVRVSDVVGYPAFDPSTIHINYNDIVGNTLGIQDLAASAAVVDAAFNFWGEDGPTTSGNVNTAPTLPASVFSSSLLVYQGGAFTLIVNSETGSFAIYNGSTLISSGGGARVQKGVLKIHSQDNQGNKIDIKGDADGAISGEIKRKNQRTDLALNAVDVDSL